MDSPLHRITDLTDREREVLRRVVESYLESGDPVGSRTLTRNMSQKISAATIRNVMQDLELLGLLGSPHVSSGRIPTETGLRMFLDSLLEVETLTDADRSKMDAAVSSNNQDIPALLDQVGATLSGLTRGASLVLTPKRESEIRHIDFVGLGPDRALAVLVFSDGQVENRIFTPAPGLTPSAMREAANFLNAIGDGKTLAELRVEITHELAHRRQEIDSIAQTLVEAGTVLWENAGDLQERLIVRGRANLLPEGEETHEINRLRHLFDDLERKRDIASVLELAEDADGVRIFIGSENKLFSLSGSALVISPYMNAERKIVGAVGVIGPTRLNYGRVVPVVRYSAQLVGRLIDDRSKG